MLLNWMKTQKMGLKTVSAIIKYIFLFLLNFWCIFVGKLHLMLKLNGEKQHGQSTLLLLSSCFEDAIEHVLIKQSCTFQQMNRKKRLKCWSADGKIFTKQSMYHKKIGMVKIRYFLRLSLMLIHNFRVKL